MLIPRAWQRDERCGPPMADESHNIARQPWLEISEGAAPLLLIAPHGGRVGRIIARHGHATVLLIHGWNIIEPRIDFGLGLRQVNGKLLPPVGAHVSASDSFINGPVRELSERLRETGIIPSFGMRYPGGDRQNLLQAFTARHETSTLPPLQALAAMASRGEIDALQLEM